MALAAAGLVGFGVVVYWFTNQGPPLGWGSIMAALLVFSGTQLVLLGIIGEYLGRMFLTEPASAGYCASRHATRLTITRPARVMSA